MLGVLGNTGAFVKAQTGKSALALAAFLGLLSAFALPPYPFAPLFFISIPLFMIQISMASSGKRAFVLGWMFGLGYFGMGLYWVGESFLAQSETPHWVAPFAVALLVMYQSLFVAAAAMISRNIWGTKWGPRALMFAGVFISFEWLRGAGDFSFPWNITSSIWWAYTEMMQGAALVGGYGLGAITLLAAGLMVSLFDKAVPTKDRIGMSVLGMLILFSLGLLGWARLGAVQTDYHDGITLRLVQANIPQTEKWDPELLQRNFDRYIQMSKSPGSAGMVPTHLIWPETAIPYNVADPAVRTYLTNGLGDQVTIISGANRYGGEDEGGVFNSIYALGPGFEILDVYDKVRLVPFGEYDPAAGLLSKVGLDTLVDLPGDFSRGAGLKIMTLPGLPPFSPLICYEIIYPGGVKPEDSTPAWILNLTNDAWFGISPGPYQHFETARMRAIEEGVPVVRVSGSGISGVVDPLGRVTARLELDQIGVLDVALPRPLVKKTLYSDYGSVIFVILVSSFLLMGMIVKGGPKQDYR